MLRLQCRRRLPHPRTPRLLRLSGPIDDARQPGPPRRNDQRGSVAQGCRAHRQGGCFESELDFCREASYGIFPLGLVILYVDTLLNCFADCTEEQAREIVYRLRKEYLLTPTRGWNLPGFWTQQKPKFTFAKSLQSVQWVVRHVLDPMLHIKDCVSCFS